MDPERLARLREEYAAEGLDETAAGDDPIVLFDSWLDAAVASGLPEPNAMALATATPGGVPSVRMVLLKGFDRRGATFFTNYESRKAGELETNPRAALAMLWHLLRRQVRIEGPVARIPEAESDAYFASRPYGSRLGAAASPQSRVVADRAELDRRYSSAEAAAGAGPVERPAHWGGYRVEPQVMEFWQGRAERMHDRLRFTRAGDGWRRERLAP
ncbi:MAG: pyridoxamine 5'-phosphate oxidase [Nocardioidaceae bacterium]